MTSRTTPHTTPDVDDEAINRERRKSSADNLERLYTIMAGLCLATAVAHLLSETTGQNTPDALSVLVANVRLRYDVAPMFVALLITLLPFYHGANRYIFDTYVLGAGGLPSAPGAMLDFAFFFVQAMLFYAMALVVADGAAFYALLVVLLLSDCIWSALAVVARRADWSNAKLWLALNLVTSLVVIIALVGPGWPNGIGKWAVLAGVAVIRTACDYLMGRQFYWPGLTLWGTSTGKHRLRHENAHPAVPGRADTSRTTHV
jgi:hypothetical protein